MQNTAYEIRVCDSCGLRYPLVEGHPFGTRCPVCAGETHVVLSRMLVTEPTPGAHRDQEDGKKQDERKIAVLLDNIRSAWNVGSILRSADGFGFTHAFLCGITPTGDNEAVAKTSLGAEESVPWSYHKDALRLVKGLKAEGWKISALEEDQRALNIKSASRVLSGSQTDSSQRVVVIVGNEITGVDPDLLEQCDEILYIPMRGDKRSFNVAIAFGIAAYALTVRTSGS